MRWLEVIHLRVAVRDLEHMLPVFKQLIVEIREKENCGEVMLFRRALVETDICLHLYHDSARQLAAGSPVGERLAAALKPFGLVNHTVWLAGEQESTQ